MSLIFCFPLNAQQLKQAEQSNFTMRFAVPYFPPYIYLDENKELTGHAIQRVSQVLDKMSLSYEYELVANYGVALEYLNSSRVDGFFLATQNRYRDQVAKMSDAVLINNWSWFYVKGKGLSLEDEQFKTQARVGTILNSNTQIWLQDNEFLIATLSRDAETLVRMLINGRLDAVFLSESVFLHALNDFPEAQDKIDKITESSRDFSVYFANKFLSTHDWFLASFNDELAKIKAKEKGAQ